MQHSEYHRGIQREQYFNYSEMLVIIKKYSSISEVRLGIDSKWPSIYKRHKSSSTIAEAEECKRLTDNTLTY